MASNVPIIASDLPSIREVLNKENSLLVEPDNHQKLSEAINCIVKNEDFSREIADNAYQNVKNYTWHKRAEKILSQFII
jgi:glycosyltransferase involved in cell wall biosynthesis